MALHVNINKMLSYTLTIFFVGAISHNVHCQNKNSCPTFKDYFRREKNPNCFYNPDVYADTSDIIGRHFGYHESHDIITEDGYILQAYRIPRNDSKGIIMFQHPVTTDAIIWVTRGKDSMAFIFWNAGYEIWLPSVRGTYSSQKHVNMTQGNFTYWDFSFHEIGVYDMKACIRFIRSMTNNARLIVVAHSMGSTESMVYSTVHAKEAEESVKVFILMAPTLSMKYFQNPILALMTQYVPIAKYFMEQAEVGSILEFDSMLSKFLRTLCIDLPLQEFCMSVGELNTGWNMDEFDVSLSILIPSQNPRGVSMKSIYHFAQILTDGGEFKQFDYGKKKNLELYNSETPPEYPIEAILAPIYFMYGTIDSQISTNDTEEMFSRLQKKARIYGKAIFPQINHIDFLFGYHSKQIAEDIMLKLMNKISNSEKSL